MKMKMEMMMNMKMKMIISWSCYWAFSAEGACSTRHSLVWTLIDSRCSTAMRPCGDSVHHYERQLHPYHSFSEQL